MRGTYDGRLLLAEAPIFMYFVLRIDVWKGGRNESKIRIQ